MYATMPCWLCSGAGQIADYGPFGIDFYGAKECPRCDGTGQIRARDSKGRFIANKNDKTKDDSRTSR